MADLEYRVEREVGTILLNRPEKRNAFTVEMVDEWARILREARFDDSVRAVVVTGAGDPSARSDLRTSLDLIASHMAVVQSTEDSREAFHALREKRSPRFTGR